MQPLSVLLVEDNPGDARLIQELVKDPAHGAHRPEVTSSLAAALGLLGQRVWDVVLLDLGLPDSQGLETFTRVHAAHPKVPIVVLSGLGDTTVALEAVRLGAQDYLNKNDLTAELLGRALLYARERHRAEQKQRDAALHWQATFDAIGDAVCLLDPQQRIVRCNKAMLDLLGITSERVIGRQCFEVVHFCDAPHRDCPFQCMSEQKTRANAQLGQSGAWFDVCVDPLFDAEGQLAGAVHTMSNITERRAAEQALRNAQERLAKGMRLESLGRLAGGIAHDFNNLLAVVLVNTELIAMDHSGDQALLDDLEQISEAAHSASALVKQLLAFSCRQVLEPVLLDCNTVVRDLENIMRRLLGENIRLVCDLEPELDSIEADPTQIEQIIMNLAINARDAMPQGGMLSLSTRTVMQKGQPRVVIEVTDTGHGMDEATRLRLFEPFFTTKEQGKGTGLGLATVYGIVTQSHGDITVRSTPGQGTTFEIYLPAKAGSRAPAHQPAPPQTQKGSETLLLVEDEPSLRMAAARALRREGYTVLTAGDYSDALRVVSEWPDTIHILVTDVVLPGPSGRRVADDLLGQLEDLRVLFTSGYAHDHIAKLGVLPEGTSFLHKPYSLQQLARRVRALLDAAPAGER
jgi:two-component system, cell cycle sensor histidine kinase and response regulator CckA